MLSLTSKNHKFGDICLVLGIINIAVYVSVMVAHANQVPGVDLSPTFEKLGFCLAGDPNNVLMQVNWFRIRNVELNINKLFTESCSVLLCRYIFCYLDFAIDQIR